VWQRSDTRQEILDEALVWACKNNRVEVLALLTDRGARLDADPYRGTPLLWASACAALDAVRWLLDQGADVNQQATFGGPGHGEGVTALHLAAERGDMPMIQLLCDSGADVAIKDRLYDSTPLGWADHNGRAAAREYLLSKSH
jgi:ankyrin repeat protein